MTDLTDEQKTEYFRRSYTAADGLWFMRVEERLGFEEALRLDEAVWKVLPKIQARTLKKMMKLENNLHGLQEALSTRLALEGFDYEMQRREDGLAVIISRCPWHDAMIRSGRELLSQRVSDVICDVENSVWSAEFSGSEGENNILEIGFERGERICKGERRCMLFFKKQDKEI